MSHKYTIKEEAKDPMDSVIIKEGGTVEFTLRALAAERIKTEKFLKECEGQLTVSKAKMANIEEHHPFVKTMSEQDRFTVHMYHEQFAIVKVLEPEVVRFRDAIEQDKEEAEEINRQIGIAIPKEIFEATTMPEKVPENKTDEKNPEGDTKE